LPPAALRWLNRLSDWLFVAARWINAAWGVQETPWRPSRGGG
ncbi:ATP:cob(I)alamin adenosyltransferase, partial [bacterium]|nr:ATP:cob(I)alamin adenosyltransferase [bacterium]